MLKFFKIFYLYSLLSGISAFAQTGPGGVGTSASNILWLKADNITGLTDGDKVSTWSDISGNGKNVTQASVPAQPVYNTGQVNGFPAIYFSGTSGTDYCRLVCNPFAGFATSALTAFVVNKNNAQTGDALLSYATTANNNDFLLFSSSALQFYRGANVTSAVAANDNSFHVIGSRWRSSDGAVRIHKDGTQGYTGTVSSGSNITSGGSLAIAQEQDAVDGSYDASQDHIGYFSEIFLYNSYLNDAQMIIIQNYLSSKYNLTMASNDKYSYESTGHYYDLAGVGRVDASNIHNDAQSGGILQTNTFSDLENGEYMLFAHDNASLSWNFTETPGSDLTNIRRISREWRVNETGGDGDLGTFTVVLDTTLLSARPTNFSQFIVMVDADGDFSSGATSYPMSYVSGSKFQATGVDVADGYYISFATIRPVIQFTLSSSADFETAGSSNVQIYLNYPLSTNATVNYSVGGGSTATGGGTDYTLAAGTATITAGTTTTNISVALNNDVAVESDETVIINLASPSAGIILGTTTTHTFTIHDEDNSRKIDFTAASSSASESTIAVSLTIQINTADATNPTTVDYTVTGGTATGSGTDYTLASGTATIVNGVATTTTLNFTVVDDATFESNETIIITLSNPTNSNLGTNYIYTYTINDNDVAPTVAFAQSASSGSEASSPAPITVTLSALSGAAVTVDYIASGGTATGSGTDYTLSNGTCIIPAGSLTGTISSSIVNDAITEIDETFNVTISNPTGASLGATTVHTYTIMDNDNDGFVGPGGVGNSSNNILWLRGDDISGLADGAGVATWADTSGNNFDLTQSTAGFQPLYKTSIVNSKPVVRFDGNDDYLIKNPFAAFATSEITTFLVNKNSESGDALFSYESGANEFLLYSSNNVVIYRNGATTTSGISLAGGVFNVSGVRWRASDGDVKLHKNGTQSYSATLSSGTSITAGGSLVLGQEQDSPGGGFQVAQAHTGDYAEVAIFKKRLNDAQMIIVQNYLAAKYNVAMASNDKFTYEATHGNEVAGIGRVDANNMHLAAQSAKILKISNANSVDDNDYFLFGHDNGSIASWTSTDAPTASGTERLAREWRFDNTGTTMGTVTVTIDTTRLPARSAGYSGFVLMVDGDGTFAAGATLYSLVPIGGGLFEATNVTINDGDYVGIASCQNITKQDGNFNDATTWLIGVVPSSGSLATILNTHDVTLTSSQSIGSVIISAGGSLNLSSYTLTLTNGTISNSGAFTASTGTVCYGQTGAQTVAALTYYGLTTAGSGTKTLAGNIIIGGNLTIGSGTTLNTGTNYSIDIAGNWLNSGTFTTNNSTITFNGSSAQSITASSLNETFYNLVVNNSSVTGITINQDITITNSLTLTDGNIYSNSAALVIISDNATASSGSSSSFVSGPMQKIGDDNFTFPVGKGTYWARLGMTTVGGFAATTKFTCEYFTTSAPFNNNPAYKGTGVDHASGVEYWDLTRTFDTGNDASANITLYWESSTRSGITTASDLRVVHLSSSTGKWEDQGGSIGAVPANGSITSTTPFVNFSPTAFGSAGGSNPLPVGLLNFRAVVNSGNGVDLNWTTASEVNNDYFTIERSADAIYFSSVLIVKGKGNSSIKLDYKAVDNIPLSGTSYYRLKQTDFDGKYTYSNIVSVEFNGNGAFFTVYPNPTEFGDKPHIRFNVSEAKDILVVVNDINGKEVFSKVTIVEQGDGQVVAIDPSNTLPAGVYIISASSENSISRQKLIIR